MSGASHKKMHFILSIFFVFSITGHGQSWTELNNRTGELIAGGEYRLALPVANQAVEMAGKRYGHSSAKLVVSLNKLGELYIKLGADEKAEPLFLQAKELQRKLLGENNLEYITILIHLGWIYAEMGQLDKSKPVIIQAKRLTKKLSGENSPAYASCLSVMAWINTIEGQFSAADSLFNRSLDIRKRTIGENDREYAESVDNLAYFYDIIGKNDSAESLYLYDKQLRQKILGNQHPDYAFTLNNLSNFYIKIGQFDKAEPLSIETNTLYEKIFGVESSDYANGLSTLSTLYNQTGQYEKAESVMIQALAIEKKARRENSPLYGTILGNLGLLYVQTGDFKKAEPLYDEEKTLVIKRSGENSSDYASVLNGYAALYHALGQYEKAEASLIQVADIQGRLFGKNHQNYGVGLHNLAVVYMQTGDYEKAEALFLKVKDIIKSAVGERHFNYAETLTNLANLYFLEGRDEEARLVCLQAVEIQKESFGDNHPSYAASLNQMGMIYDRLGYPDSARQLYSQAMGIQLKTLGSSHPAYAKTLNNLALLEARQNKFAIAEALIIAGSDVTTKNVKDYFTALSEREKNNYLQNNVNSIDVQNTYLYLNKSASDSFVLSGFNQLLFYKSLSLLDTKKMLESIEDSPDSSIQTFFGRWRSDKELLAKQYTLPKNKRIRKLDSIEMETESMEQALTRRSSEFRDQKDLVSITASDVRRKLADKEAAVEFVKYRVIANDKADTVLYAAYVLTRRDEFPKFVPLCEERQIQRLLDSAGSTTIAIVANLYRGAKTGDKQNFYFGDSLYKLIWAPLEPYLSGISRISFAPAGKLFNVAFSALPISKTGILLDKYDFQQLSSTRQIALRDSDDFTTKATGIVLFGDPQFSGDSAALVMNHVHTSDGHLSSNAGFGMKTRGFQDQGWASLPGTAEEVRAIGDLFQLHGLKTKAYTRDIATEENLKGLSGHSPEILHIATHAFVLADPPKAYKASLTVEANPYQLADDPLMRSGLIFSGANYVWTGHTPIPGIDDGIATSYEIAQLNLRSTQLVVLSACETALGDVIGSEGVFGLQRAFKLAGAKKLIVSLWQVPDKETAELMTAFYSHWIMTNSIESAFKKAQAEMRRKYPPYYWAAFVLID